MISAPVDPIFVDEISHGDKLTIIECDCEDDHYEDIADGGYKLKD